jgi:hypothetical protein
MVKMMDLPNDNLLEIMKFLDFKNCCKPCSLFNFILLNKKFETLYAYWKKLNLLHLSNNYVMKLGCKNHPHGQIKLCHLCRNFNDDEMRSVNNLICDIKNKGVFKYYIDTDNKEKFLDKLIKCSSEFDIKTETIYLVNLNTEIRDNCIDHRSVYIRLPFRY